MIYTFSKTLISMSTFLTSLLNLFLAIILPVQAYLLLIGGFILLDTFYGVLVSMKGSKEFNFKLMITGIIRKIAVYSPAMLGVYYLDATLLNEFVSSFISIDSAITKIGCAILMSAEIASINDSIKKLTGKGIMRRIREGFGIAKEIKNESRGL
jgi:hypothetical protein